MKSKSKFKVFIDDTGSKEYQDPYNINWKDTLINWSKYRGFAERNFFVLTAIILDITKIAEINKEINLLKLEYFKTTKLEIKSTWFRNPQKQKNVYLRPYNLTKVKLLEFITKYYEIISSRKDSITILSIIFNKMAFSERKRCLPDGNPFLKTTQVLLDRLSYLHQPIEMIIDQMESDLRLTNGKNGEMIKVYSKKEEFKIDFKVDYKNIVGVNFKKSSSENFLQMADLCGYNVFRQFVDYGVNTDYNNRYEFFDKIFSNIRNKNGTVDGWGIVKLGVSNKKQKVPNSRDLLKSVSSKDTHIV